MAVDPDPLISSSDIAYRLDLTAAQLKVTHSALRAMLADFGHDEPDVHFVLRQILSKLPSEESIRAIDLDVELGRRRRGA
jgi:hypothetical protein